MTLYALDPGPERSALVAVDNNGRPLCTKLLANADMLRLLGGISTDVLAVSLHDKNLLIIEQVAGYGMPVGAEVFETVFWSGRFAEAWATGGGHWTRLPRRAVKLALCGTARATDATIRQALLDRYGPGRERAIGRKHAPGPLYGIKADLWQALALAVTYREQHT